MAHAQKKITRRRFLALSIARSSSLAAAFGSAILIPAVPSATALLPNSFIPYIPFCAGDLFEGVPVEPLGPNAPPDPNVREDRRLISARSLGGISCFQKLAARISPAPISPAEQRDWFHCISPSVISGSR